MLLRWMASLMEDAVSPDNKERARDLILNVLSNEKGLPVETSPFQELSRLSPAYTMRIDVDKILT